jgi:serine/threonine protein kinase
MDSPSSIGRYKITRWLTSGAMGDIYEAHDPVIERPVAVKVLRRELIARDDAGSWLDRFRQEARAAGRLLHPNIVTLLDYGEQDGIPFLAMEFVEGESLDHVLKRSGRLPCAEAVAIVTQTLNALEFAHAHHVVHRDIKPSNILLTKSGLAKITDFGIAHIEASDLTGAGDVLGTPSYMAPEQLAGKAADPRADQFATAAVFFELLSGVKPFQGKSLAESMLNMERRGPSDICALNPEVSLALKAVIDRALAFDPERRYSSAAEFARAIGEVAAMTPSAMTPPVAAPPPRLDETMLAPVASASAAASFGEPGPVPLAIELLTQVERDLTTFIGPLAKIAVRRSAKTISDIAALYQTLSSYIDDEGERASFISKGQQRRQTGIRPSPGDASGRAHGRTPAPRTAPTIVINPDMLSGIEADLTKYIGPIAPIVVRQLLSRSASLPDFYRDLAAYIPDDGDRTDFLKSRRGP